MPIMMLPLVLALLGVTFDEMTQRSEAWLRSPEGAAVVENVLARQTFTGSWPKNADNTQPLDAESPDDMTGTLDNLAEMDRERRNGYGWHGAWGAAVLKRYEKRKTAWPE